MKKAVSIILFLVMMIHTSAPVLAQSSPQNEIQALQRCMNEKFATLQAELSKNSKQPIVLDEQDRLEYSQLILSQLLIGFDRGMSKLKLTGITFTLSSIISSYLAYKSYANKVIHQEILNGLDSKFKVMQYDPRLLAEFGGEKTVNLQKDLTRNLIKKGKLGAIAFGVVALFTGFFAYASLKSLKQNKEAFQDAQPSLAVLIHAKSEVEFNQALSSSDHMISELRRFSLEACKTIPIQEIAVILESTLKLSEQQQMDAAQIIQETLDTLPQE